MKGLFASLVLVAGSAVALPMPERRPQLDRPAEAAKAVAAAARPFVLKEDLSGALSAVEAKRRELVVHYVGKAGLSNAFERVCDLEAAKVYDALMLYDEEVDFLERRGRTADAARVIADGKIDDVPRLERLFREVLDGRVRNATDDRTAYLWLLSRGQKDVDRYLPSALGKCPAETNLFLNTLVSLLSRGHRGNPICRTRNPAYLGRWHEAIEIWKVLRQVQRTVGVAPDFKCTQYAAEAYAATGDFANMRQALAEGQNNAKLKAAERYMLAMTAALVGTSGSEEEQYGRAKAEDGRLGEGLGKGERLPMLDRVGCIANLSGNESLLRALARLRRELATPGERMVCKVRYSNHAISGVRDWDRLDPQPEVQEFRRRFGGGSLDFMTTDVATGDRGQAAAAVGRERPVTLQAAADEWGIHVRFEAFDSRAKEFAAELKDFGSFESYLATGENQPYVCVVQRLRPGGKPSVFQTTYPTSGHRRPDPDDRESFRHEIVYTDTGAVAYFAFSWNTWATLVPKTGMRWDFESVFWGPTKAAWNGTESIHGRSSWGRLEFEIPEAARLKILRKIIHRTVREFREQQASVRAIEGSLFRWRDPELGDPVFYSQEVEPLVLELNAAAERATADMTDETVRDLAENYLQRWRDIDFTVQRLRARYLKRLHREGRPAPDPERWYGLMLNDGHRQPYDTIGEWDLAYFQAGGAAVPMLLSTEGRYIWSDRPFVFAFTNGVPMILEAKGKVVRGRAGVTLRDAYLEMMKAHFPFDGRMPPREFFEKPQFNNWIESICVGFDRKKAIDDYITGIETNGYPCGVFEIDAGFQTFHGSNAFDPKKMPDPQSVYRRIRKNGWKTILWTSFNVLGGTPVAQEFARHFVRTPKGDLFRFGLNPDTGRHSVLWDLTNPKAYEAFAGRLRAFADEYGFDGYKFDMGDPFNFNKTGGYAFADHRATPSDYTRLYATLAERFPYHEFRIGYCSGGKPIVQRLADTSHEWSFLKRMSTDVQVGGLLGSPYVVPDMIGGGQESDWKKPDFKPDEKLFVRMAAIQALQPMMQFSVAPWRVLSAEGNALCRTYAELHVKTAPYILGEVVKTAKTGEPLVRMMEYAYPHQGFAKQMTQYMLGEDLLVAPVCSPDDSVVVELPKGRWSDDLGELHVGPKTLNLKDVPLARLPHYWREGRKD